MIYDSERNNSLMFTSFVHKNNLKNINLFRINLILRTKLIKFFYFNKLVN